MWRAVDSEGEVLEILTHLTNTVKPDGTIGTLNDWHAGSVEWGHAGDVGIGFADPFSSITAKAFVGKGFGDVEAEWLRPIAVTGEIDYTWSTHPNDFLFDPIADTLTVCSCRSHSPALP
jgi:hypothetical protein